jgi:uncharacterized protein (UPF0333 family)
VTFEVFNAEYPQALACSGVLNYCDDVYFIEITSEYFNLTAILILMTKEQKFLLLIVLIIAGASVTYYYVESNPAKNTPTPVTSTDNQPSATETQAKSFSADVTYVTPEEGRETIHVIMNLSGETINDITFTYDVPKKRESKENIANFERAFKALSFKGTKLPALSLPRTGGASLTTKAFNDAVDKIRLQAING